MEKQLPRRWLIRVGKVSGLLYSLNGPIIASSEPPRLLESHVNGLVNQSLPRKPRYLSRSPGLEKERSVMRVKKQSDGFERNHIYLSLVDLHIIKICKREENLSAYLFRAYGVPIGCTLMGK